MVMELKPMWLYRHVDEENPSPLTFSHSNSFPPPSPHLSTFNKNNLYFSFERGWWKSVKSAIQVTADNVVLYSKKPRSLGLEDYESTARFTKKDILSIDWETPHLFIFEWLCFALCLLFFFIVLLFLFGGGVWAWGTVLIIYSLFFGFGVGGWVWFWGRGFVVVWFRLRDNWEGYGVELRGEDAQILLQAFYPLGGEEGEEGGEEMKKKG